MLEDFDRFTLGYGVGSGGTAIGGAGGWVMVCDLEIVLPVHCTGGIVSGFDVSVFLGVRGGGRGEYSVTLVIGWDRVG